MSPPYPLADWSRLSAEPDLPVPLPGGLTLLVRRIPRGSFVMGARGESADEEPRHRVVLPHDFWLGKFVVTQAEWRAVAALDAALTREPGLDPSDERNTGDRRPVTDVSWDDASAWCEALTRELARLERPPEFLAGLTARLPTEAEREYACRAGTETEYYSGDGEAALAEVAWFGEDWERGAHAVDECVGGRPERHPAGLCGMHGNVWEWCRDVYRDRENVYRRRVDGAPAVEEILREGEEGKDDRQLRVMRGGSWGFSPWGCRSACRSGREPDYRIRSQGFRLCLAPGPAEPKEKPEEERRSPDRETEGEGRARSRTGRAEPGAGDFAWENYTLPAKPAEK
ncbi:MAG: hypothetical protein RLZZ15_4563 [Verrucomicrobiota bacterium]|jgi:formylglycine-generating enzyme required for sulfatase activity